MKVKNRCELISTDNKKLKNKITGEDFWVTKRIFLLTNNTNELVFIVDNIPTENKSNCHVFTSTKSLYNFMDNGFFDQDSRFFETHKQAFEYLENIDLKTVKGFN